MKQEKKIPIKTEIFFLDFSFSNTPNLETRFFIEIPYLSEIQDKDKEIVKSILVCIELNSAFNPKDVNTDYLPSAQRGITVSISSSEIEVEERFDNIDYIKNKQISIKSLEKISADCFGTKALIDLISKKTNKDYEGWGNFVNEIYKKDKLIENQKQKNIDIKKIELFKILVPKIMKEVLSFKGVEEEINFNINFSDINLFDKTKTSKAKEELIDLNTFLKFKDLGLGMENINRPLKTKKI